MGWSRVGFVVGQLGVWAGVVGVVVGGLILVYPAAVAEGVYSYPFGAGAFAGVQVVLMVRDFVLALVLLGVGLSGAVGRSRAGWVGVVGSGLAMVGLAVLEVASVVARTRFGGVYGVLSLMVGVSAIVGGVAVVRARVWGGWQRFLLLGVGVYVFVPMTPGILAGPVGEQLAIAGWMVVFAVLGGVVAARSRHA
ncbi:hypothetical protein OG474_00230 [Kribbella sp. NBC_01505]|uniref:hypothetical protein n=1 Tax=Kribbella sp. NBC_01505 TaxID=2903580 RepID=UPI003863B8A6